MIYCPQDYGGFLMSKQTRISLQDFLKSKGFNIGNSDGIIGKNTKQAILDCFKNKKALAITSAQTVALAQRLGDTNTDRIRAVAKVEANGSGWFTDGRPKILYERHKFWAHNDEASAPKSTYFNYPSWGNYTVDADNNGVNDSYDKLLKACEYDPRAAFMSVSMGAFQVMGEYYKQMGYKEPWDMLFACTHEEYAQYQLLVSYIEMNKGQSKFLSLSEKPDACRPFAQMYNGKLYAKNDYHGKLASAVIYFKKLGYG